MNILIVNHNLPAHDLLRTVQEYIDTATPQQINKDLKESNFEEYRGIGEKIELKIIDRERYLIE